MDRDPMASNLFDRLADLEVPPPPAHFDKQLHDKVNRSLVASQFADLFLSGLPWALGHFARAFIGLVVFSVTGNYDTKPKDKRR